VLGWARSLQSSIAGQERPKQLLQSDCPSIPGNAVCHGFITSPKMHTFRLRAKLIQRAQRLPVYASKHNPLHLIECDSIIPPIIEAGRSWAFMPRHLLRNFELAAILQVRRDALYWLASFCPAPVA